MQRHAINVSATNSNKQLTPPPQVLTLLPARIVAAVSHSMPLLAAGAPLV